jgi:cation transport regulator
VTYKRKRDLPKQVRDNLPEEAQDIYRKAYNSAWEQYKDPEDRRGDASREETSHKVAWNAVKKEYKKDDKSGKWKKKD